MTSGIPPKLDPAAPEKTPIIPILTSDSPPDDDPADDDPADEPHAARDPMSASATTAADRDLSDFIAVLL
jgi:hypothetical protein